MADDDRRPPVLTWAEKQKLAHERRMLRERHAWLCFVHRELLANAPPGTRFPDYEHKIDAVAEKLRALPREWTKTQAVMEEALTPEAVYDQIGVDAEGKPIWEPKARWRSDISLPVPPPISTVRRDRIVATLAQAIGEAFADKDWPAEWSEILRLREAGKRGHR